MPSPPPPSADAAAWSLLLEHHARVEAKRLVAREGSVSAALSASAAARGKLGNGSRVERRMRDLASAGVGLLCESDSGFPALLRCIPDAPCLIYYRGNRAAFDRTSVAVVGARRASRTGLELARTLAGELAGCGLAVVSGLALGVDGAAHRGALNAGGPTVAVLGSGVDRVQPLANAPLARDLLAGGGLIISEYPPGTPAAPYRFPERNRLISGLSAGVVVVEASMRSGSLITARLAHEQGREVMAVPGAPGLPNSGGGNRLLKEGAALVESAADVLGALGRDLPELKTQLAAAAGPETGSLTPELARLLDRLDGRAQSVDHLAADLALDVQTCAVRLTELELGGFVRRVADGYIRRPF